MNTTTATPLKPDEELAAIVAMDQRIAAVVALHYPDAIQTQHMVYEVWEDGEVTLTKAMDLYGRRNLHCIVPGNPACALPIDALPVFNGRHSRIVAKDKDAANEAATIIMGPCPYTTNGRWVR